MLPRPQLLPPSSVGVVFIYRVRNFFLPHRSACGLASPLARKLQRPVRETVTPAVLEKVVWAGANLNSFPQASAALKMIGEIDLSAKRVRATNSLQSEIENKQVATNSTGWSEFAPQLVSKEVIASSECATGG